MGTLGPGHLDTLHGNIAGDKEPRFLENTQDKYLTEVTDELLCTGIALDLLQVSGK